MAKGREVSIIGAGPVGLVAALYLAKRGIGSTVYEGRPDPRQMRPSGGRSINLTIAARGWKALADVDADAAIQEISLPLRARCIHHQDGSTTVQPYGSAGEALYSVSRAQLSRVLMQIAESNPRIRLRFGHRLVQLDPQTALLEFERPELGTALNVRASVLLAADGVYSAARPSLLRSHAAEYRQTYSRHWYKELRIPPRADWPLDPSHTHVWPRKDAMLVAFPNINRSFTATLFLPMEGPLSFGALRTRDDLLELFRRTFADVLPLAPDLDFAFFSKPVVPIVTLQCSPWTWMGKFALIGDAAHGMVPFLGQGMNAGLEDCTVLNASVERFDANWPEVLSDYAERRKPDCDVITALAEEHYQELAIEVDDPRFHLRRLLERRLQAEHPDHFLPIYNLVAFTTAPYSLARAMAERQDPLVRQLVAIPDVEQRWGTDDVQRVIRAFLERTPALPKEVTVLPTSSRKSEAPAVRDAMHDDDYLGR